MLAGWVPGTEIRLGRMREGEHDHRPGLDITLSAPKSVSLEALVVGDRRVIRAHDDAVRATLDWIETDLLQTRGFDPMTRQRPRVAAHGMAVAGFRHLTSRIGDPQLHTHCVLANMTRNASGEWRSVEPTTIKRGEKLIGAYYRNELAKRVEALGMAVTPRMIGRVPGFELAGYDQSFMDAFSGRRAEILAYLKEHDLPYNAKNAEKAALRTRQGKEDMRLSDLVPEWRQRAREMGLVRDRGALRPDRPIDPVTGERVEPVEVPPPDLPANELRSLRRAPALPRLPKLPREAWVRSRGPAELSPAPELGVLEAVARAVSHVAERRTAIPETEIRAVALGHAPGRYTLAEIDGAIDRLVAGRRADRGGTQGDRPRLRHRAGGAGRARDHRLHARRAGRGEGALRHERGRGAARRQPADRGPEGGGAHGAAVGRSGRRGPGPCRQRQDDDAARGEGTPGRAADPGARAVGRGGAGAGARGGDPVDDAAMVPHPLRRDRGRRAARPGVGRLPRHGAGGGRVLDDRHRPHGGAAADRRAPRGGPGSAGGRHGAAPGGGCGPALPPVAEGGHADRDDGRGAAPARPGAAGLGDACAGGRGGGGDPGSRRAAGARGGARGARRRGGAVLARAVAGGPRGDRGHGADPRDPPPDQRGGARGARRGGRAARPGARGRPAGQPAPHPGAGRRACELRAGRHGGVPPRRVRLPQGRYLHGDGPRGRQGRSRPCGRRGTRLPAVGQRGDLSGPL